MGIRVLEHLNCSNNDNQTLQELFKLIIMTFYNSGIIFLFRFCNFRTHKKFCIYFTFNQHNFTSVIFTLSKGRGRSLSNKVLKKHSYSKHIINLISSLLGKAICYISDTVKLKILLEASNLPCVGGL